MELRFELKLESADGLPRPNARLWLDLSADYDLEDGEEVALTSVDRLSWIGVLHFNPARSVDGLFFLLRFVAPVGTRWSFSAVCGDEEVYVTHELPALKLNRESLTGYLRSKKIPAGRDLSDGRRSPAER